MLVDLHRRVQLELVALQIVIRRPFMTVAPILVADPALPLHVVHLFLQSGDADAEAIELVGKFSGEAVDQGAITVPDANTRHGSGHHLRHLVAGDLLIAAIGAVAVAFDDAVGGKLRHRVVSPVIRRYIRKGIGGGKAHRVGGHDGRCGGSGS